MIRTEAPDGVNFVRGLDEARCDLVLFWPDEPAGLEERFRQLQARIDPAGAVWAIIPKKKFARARGNSLTWEQLQAAALRTDLVDNKIASVSEQEYGTRFVIRKDRRDKYRTRLTCFSIIIALLLASCAGDPNENFIQGTWYHDDPHIRQVVGESFQETLWTFDRGTYSTYGCCFLRAESSGRYEIVESEGDSLIIELFNLGKPNADRVQVKITIDREAGTLDIQRAGPFTRFAP